MIYIAFLRGINVGGKNLIKMDKLKQIFSDLGFVDIQTYIQSGNVIFRSNDNPQNLVILIEKSIESIFGIETPVILRNTMELDSLLENSPFALEMADNSDSYKINYHVALMKSIPSEDETKKLAKIELNEDKYKIEGDNVYFSLSDGIRNSKIVAAVQRIKTVSTVRNLNTLIKIQELIKNSNLSLQ